MKNLIYSFLVIYIVFATALIYSQSFDYISPRNNSQFVSLTTNIILKSSENVNASSLTGHHFTVSGTKSGEHSGTIKLADDNKTILFIPSRPFVPGEYVNINVGQEIQTTSGAVLPKVSFQFLTTPLVQPIKVDPLSLLENKPITEKGNVAQSYKSLTKISSPSSLPSDFPGISLVSSTNPSEGKIFMTNFSILTGDTTGNYLIIANNDGSVLKYKKLNGEALDFKVLPNGQLSYSSAIISFGSYGEVIWIVTDTSLAPIDTFKCGNGYTADFHDFLLLPNGHAIMEAYDPEPVDMSRIAPGGNPNATVIGSVIQEVDASGNVVFQWRSWDYLPITDSYIDLTTSTVDLLHTNAFDVDANGNIVLSMRHLSSIFKIDRQTGNLDWILGGKQNQFTFLNEHQSNAPNYFSFQHNVQVQPNGDITLFDNGNQHSPAYSRAVEYKIDEVNKTADLVWEYRHSPDIYSYAMGSVQKLANGNTFIGWGIATGSGAPVFTEVKPDNTTALEFNFQPGQVSYRSYKFPWASGISAASVSVSEILQGNTYKFNSLNDTTGITIKFDKVNSSLYPSTTVNRFNYAPTNPTFSFNAPVMLSNYFNVKGTGVTSYTGEIQVSLYNYPAVTNPKTTLIYSRVDNSKPFTALPTSYDSTKNELTFTTTTSGDFAFGIPQIVDSAYAPVPISPSDGEVVNESAPVKLVWGTRGVVQAYHLQVATNSTFSNPLVDASGLNSANFNLGLLNNNSTYYWRVNNTNSAGTSSWSNTVNFNTAPPFINAISPKGGEILYLDSSYVIRWSSNSKDTVSIKLMEGNAVVSSIADTVFSGTNAVLWQVPANLKHDTTYKISVSALNNPGLFGESSSDFIIASSITDVSNINNNIKSYQLSQNYPNPFNPSTLIKYSIPQESHVRIEVFNAIGQRVSTLVNSVQKSGDYAINFNASQFASGVYYYSINASDNLGKNFFTVKKMVLLK
jgi:hypothetical protein